MQKYNNYKKLYEKIIKLLNLLIYYIEKVYKINLIANHEYENLCNIFATFLDETKN